MVRDSNICGLLDTMDNYRLAEQTLFNYIKSNKYYDGDYKELIGIEIKKCIEPKSVTKTRYYVNDSYLVIDKTSKDYNRTHHNTIFLVCRDDVTIFQKGYTKDAEEITRKIIDFFTSNQYKRKLKIESLNESLN
jgi:hypothetical protein